MWDRVIEIRVQGEKWNIKSVKGKEELVHAFLYKWWWITCGYYI